MTSFDSTWGNLFNFRPIASSLISLSYNFDCHSVPSCHILRSKKCTWRSCCSGSPSSSHGGYTPSRIWLKPFWPSRGINGFHRSSMYLVQHDNFVKNALCSSGSRRGCCSSKTKEPSELSSMNSMTHSNSYMKSKRFAKIVEQFVPIGIPITCCFSWSPAWTYQG